MNTLNDNLLVDTSTSQSDVILSLLKRANNAGIELIVEDGKLKLKVAKNATVAPELLNDLKANKEQLLSLLNDEKESDRRSGAGEGNPLLSVAYSGSKNYLSFAQERLWFIDKLNGSVNYHVPNVYKIHGKIDVVFLEKAFKSVIDRQNILKTIYEEVNGEIYQHLITRNWNLNYVSDRSLTDDQLNKMIDHEVNKPFDLSKDFVIRATLYQRSDAENLLVFVIHHIAFDGWSLSIFLQELMEFYTALVEGRQDKLLPLQLQYKEYGNWQRNSIEDGILNSQLDYWAKQLEDVEPLALPIDFQRPKTQSFLGSREIYSVNKDLTEGIKLFCKKHQTTTFTFLLALYKITLSRFSGQNDICIGTPISNRSKKEFESLIGFFVNTLAIRINKDENIIFTDFLNDVKNIVLDAFSNQDVPFDKIVEKLGTVPDLSRNQVFQTFFVFQNQLEQSEINLNNLTFEPATFTYDISKFDLTFTINERENEIDIIAVYCTELFHKETVQKILRYFVDLLELVLDKSNQSLREIIPVSEKEENNLLYRKFGQSDVSLPSNTTILDLFEKQVLKSPEKQSLFYDGNGLTFKELDQKSNQLAHFINENFTQGGIIAIAFGESLIEYIIGVLAVMKSGNAYLPLDMDQPFERIDAIVCDAVPVLILTNLEYCNHFTGLGTDSEIVVITNIKWDELSSEGLQKEIDLDSAAYVIYTSGSTGNPKGVMVSHLSIVDYIFGLLDKIDFSEFSSVGLLSTLSADLGLTVLFGGLFSGATVHLFSKDTLRDAEELHSYFQKHPIDFIKIVPSHWQAIEVGNKMLIPEKAIMFGGELLNTAIVEKIRKCSGQCLIYNHYGPTETTIGKFLNKIDTNSKYNSIPIGRPFGNTQAYVVDNYLNPCLKGVAGELLIGGYGIAMGYLNKAQQTKDQFIKNTIEPNFGGKLYRTGDLVKWLPDGNLLFLGRKDQQVKIRGHRIELGEIESVLNDFQYISQSAVVLKSSKLEEKQLVAYIVCQNEIDRENLRQEMLKKLPEYKVPHLFIELDELPLNANGKLNKKELVNRKDFIETKRELIAPRNQTELLIAKIWQEKLAVNEISVSDNFFTLGGHSLLVTRCVSEIRKAFGVHITIRDFFENPVLEQLAKKIEILPSKQATNSLVKQIMPSKIPLSYSQKRLWFIDKLEGSTTFHIPTLYKISGNLDITALEASLNEIVARHEVLRTTIGEEDGVPFQEFRNATEWSMETIIQPLTISELESKIDTLISKPFDLSKDFMLRVTLFTINNSEYQLLIVMHHIASDGWSRSIFVNELVELYHSFRNNIPSQLTDLPIQYKDFSVWQRNYIEKELGSSKLEYWGTKLKNSTLPSLPFDFPPSNKKTNEGNVLHFKLDIELSERLKAFSFENEATLFMTLTAGLNVLLSKVSQNDDISIGTSIANRLHQETESLIGFLLNTLVIRTQMNPEDSFTELIAQVRNSTLDAFHHQDVPYEKVLEQINKERKGDISPLFNVLFVLQNTPQSELVEFDNIRLTMGELKYDSAKFDLSFYMTETGNGIHVSIEYSNELFKVKTITGLFDKLTEVLAYMVNNPSKSINSIEMVSSNDQINIPVSNLDRLPENKKSVISLFNDIVDTYQDKEAIICNDERITYSELNTKVNQLAWLLLSKGIKRDELIGIYLDRSIDFIVTTLAVMKAEAAYVPIDTSYPVSRITLMLNEGEIDFIITDDQNFDEKLFTDREVILIDRDIDDELPSDNPLVENELNDLAYVIFTSGSTGKPKGILVEQRSLLEYVLTFKEFFAVSSEDKIIQQSSVAFDTFVEEVFPALISGATIYVVKEGGKDIYSLKNLIENKGITILSTTPIILEALNDELNDTFELRYLISGGELLKPNQINRLFEKVTIVNTYGPSETTVCASYFKIDSLDNASLIGKPIKHTSIQILDKNNKLLPPGLVGEICISGFGLARGYLQSQHMDSLPFFYDTQGVRYYRSGDQGRWLSDGNIEFMGRKDEQVSIRGYRIELGEIESVLLKHENIQQAVVKVINDEQSKPRLVGYIVSDNYDQQQISSFLKIYLPDFMVPNYFFHLDELPVNTNGKIDKKRLPMPIFSENRTADFVEPRNELETKIALIWKELLKLESVGIKDNFFDLGGHSLLAVRVLAKINKLLNLNLHIAAIFEFPTIELLAGQCESNLSSHSYLFNLNNSKGKTNVYLIPGIDGNSMSFRKLAEYYSDNRIITFLPINSDGQVVQFETLNDLAHFYVDELLNSVGDQKIAVGGYSFGALIAYEMVLILEQKGIAVDQLLILERDAPVSRNSDAEELIDPKQQLVNFIYLIGNYAENEIDISAFDFSEISKEAQLLQIQQILKENQLIIEYEQLLQLFDMYNQNMKLGNQYNTDNSVKIKTPLTLFKTTESVKTFAERSEIFKLEDFGWGDYCVSSSSVHIVEGNHWTFLDDPYVEDLVYQIRKVITN